MSDPSEPIDQEAGQQAARPGRVGATVRRVAIDLSPLRDSRDFRVLWIGEFVSIVGRQITVVSLPFQVFLLTRSPFKVGLIGLAQLLPLVVFSIAGGAIADRIDRRTLIIFTEAGLGATTVLLLLGAISGHPPLWYLYTATGLGAGVSGINNPARSAAVPNLVGRDRLPAALALNQILFNTSVLVGPLIAGVILARFGFVWAYTADAISSGAAIWASILLRPLPPKRDETDRSGTGWSDIREGFAYLKGKRVLQATFLIDLDAMIFGMPRALFPVLAVTVYHNGAFGLGLLNSAVGLGALIGAITSGWVGRIDRQGLAVVVAVVAWGAAITAFGLAGHLFWIAVAFLVIAGGADVISAVFRGTILQLSVPDSLRGRISAVHIMVVTGGPRLGDFEAGGVAALVSAWFSVVSGGVVCVVGALAIAAAIPGLARYRSVVEGRDRPEVRPARPGAARGTE